MMGIFLVASASAADLNETTMDDSTSFDDECMIDVGQNHVDSSFDEDILSEGQICVNHTPADFSEIQSSIENANDGDNIILDGSYITSSSDTTVIVNKTVNFIGINNAVVDGNFKIRLFEVKASNVVFKNITFKHGNTTSLTGGAICGKCTVRNCSFLDNHAYDGGAINGGYVINCTFINNTADHRGGALYYCDAINCTFINNSIITVGEYKEGGAMLLGSAMNCTFINNYAPYGGATAYINTLNNCSFIGNSANYGGAMYLCWASNSYFENNSASNDGGAVYYNLNYKAEIRNCTFINNTANSYGGAIYKDTSQNEITVIDSNFSNNFANSGGAIYRCNAFNCSFINNSAKNMGGTINYGSAVNCSFVNNSARSGGAMSLGSAVNCSFLDNHANDGGAIWSGSAVGCRFVNNSAEYDGGALRTSSAENCTFINNTAKNGGAMYYNNAVNCTFINNYASQNGGAKYHGNSTSCAFINNHAEGEGGALYSHAADLTLNCTFKNNSANNGGAMRDGFILNSLFEGNSANYGGAIFSTDSSGTDYEYQADIVNCSFIDNSANFNGGTIYYKNQKRIFNLRDCAFYNSNSNVSGGAIYILINANITNCDFTNCSSNQAGAIYFKCTNSEITLCNFTNCSSTDGGNSLIFDDLTNYIISDCIFDIPPEGIDIFYSSIFDVEDLVIFYNDEKNLVVKLFDVLGPLDGKEVIFTLNDVDYPINTNSEGIAEFNIQEYLNNFGNYTVNINYAGEGNIYPTSSNVTVHYGRYKGNLTGSVDGKYFNDTILTYKLVNTRNNVPIPNVPIVIKFSNGEIFNLKTNNRGIVTFRIPFMTGTYSATAWVNDSFTDVNVVNLTNIVIRSMKGVIELSTLNDNHTLRVKLYNKDTLDVFRNVKVALAFSHNVDVEVTTDENGIAYYEMDFENGVYSVIASVNGDYMQFDGSSLEDIVISNLSSSELIFNNDIVFDFGNYGSTNFTVYGATVDRENIHVLNHSEAIISLTGNTITVFGLSVGKYILIVETTPDDYHYAVTRTLNITVNNVKSKIILKAGIVFEYGSSSSIQVTVDGGTVERKNIKVLNHPEAVIGFSGHVITISGLAVGSYVLSVTSTPDSDHIASTETVSVTVKKATAVIKASKITVAYKKAGKWTIKFVDSKSGKAISNMVVTLKVFTGKKFKTVSLKTNSKGEANYQTKGLSKGTHKVVVSAKDSRYNLNTFASSIKVIKQTAVKFKVTRKTLKDGASLSITVKNKKTNKPINGVKIELLIYTGSKLTKTILLKTLKKGKYSGVAGYATNELSVGKHKVKITTADIKYGGSSKSSMKITKKAKKYPALSTKISAKI